jgi:hypothetical protein
MTNIDMLNVLHTYLYNKKWTMFPERSGAGGMHGRKKKCIKMLVAKQWKYATGKT